MARVTAIERTKKMSGLIIFLLVFGCTPRLGWLMGEHKERTRHERAVKEATSNITAIGERRAR